MALLQLAALGVQDAYLGLRPSMTLFKTAYEKEKEKEKCRKTLTRMLKARLARRAIVRKLCILDGVIPADIPYYVKSIHIIDGEESLLS